jgi:recombination protein RecT
MNNQLTTETFNPALKRMQELGMDIIQIKKEISFAIQHFNKNPKLMETTPESKLAAVENIANIGLTLNPVAKEAYLIPRWNKTVRGMECVLEPGYVGLVKLLTDAGSVTSIVTNIVCQSDLFKINLADNQQPVLHNPELIKSKRGEIIGCYSLATLPDGSKQVEWMDIEELYKIRNRSETYNAYVNSKISTCTWVTDETEMMRKTCLKRIYKYLPRTEKMNRVDEAIGLDNSSYQTEVQTEPGEPKFEKQKVEAIPDALRQVISEADKAGLKSIYTNNTELHSNPEFMQLLTNRKNELNASTTPA